MTPSDYATEELALWERALQEQRAAEERLEQARFKGPRLKLLALKSQVQALRTRADLLLAEAVKAKCAHRDNAHARTQPGPGRPDRTEPQ